MEYFLITFAIIFWIIFIFYIIILKINSKINTNERLIQKQLLNRADLMPWLYEISKPILVKHSSIFEEVLKLRKVQFTLNDYSVSFIEFIKNEMAINHEISFIYSICSKNKKLNSLSKFSYIKQIIIRRNKIIWDEIENYKKRIHFFNKLILIKNYTLIGLLFPVSKKFESDLIKSIF